MKRQKIYRYIVWSQQCNGNTSYALDATEVADETLENLNYGALARISITFSQEFTCISSRLSSKSSPRVWSLVKFILRLVIFKRFCTSSEYGLSIGKFGGRTLYMISPSVEGATPEYRDSQTTSVKFSGNFSGIPGKLSAQLWAK